MGDRIRDGFDGFGRLVAGGRTAERTEAAPRERPHNLFEAASAYVTVRVEDDRDGIEEARPAGCRPRRCPSG